MAGGTWQTAIGADWPSYSTDLNMIKHPPIALAMEAPTTTTTKTQDPK